MKKLPEDIGVAADENGDELIWRTDFAAWLKEINEEIDEVTQEDYHNATGMEETRKLHRRSYPREFIQELLKNMGEPLPDNADKDGDIDG